MESIPEKEIKERLYVVQGLVSLFSTTERELGLWCGGAAWMSDMIKYAIEVGVTELHRELKFSLEDIKISFSNLPVLIGIFLDWKRKEEIFQAKDENVVSHTQILQSIDGVFRGFERKKEKEE